MASYINIVDIPAQESADNLAKAFASAVAKAVSWTLDTDGVTTWATAEKKLGVRFAVVSGIVYPVIVNAGGVSGHHNNGGATFAESQTYKLYWIKTSAGTVALGIDVGTTTSPTLCIVLGKNDKGIWSILHCGDVNGTNPSFVMRSTTSTGPLSFYVPPNAVAGMPFSIVRLPDMMHGGMFADIYAVLSTPVNTPSTLYYADGRYYRPIRTKYNTTNCMALVIPVG